MLLRVLLIVTILIGIGAIAVSQFVVRPHIQTIIDAREKNLKDYQNEQRAHTKTKTELKGTKEKLAQTEKNLEDTKTQLAAANTKAADQEKRANALDQELVKTKQTLGTAQAELAAWAALGIPVDQVKNVIAEAKNLRVATEALEEEKKILMATIKKQQAKIDQYESPEDAVPILPANLRGTVLVVDPKYDFVVLDIGANKGVEPKGVLIVSHDGSLVAKVKVASVQPDRSIANIMPGWKLKPVREGDLVLTN